MLPKRRFTGRGVADPPIGFLFGPMIHQQPSGREGVEEDAGGTAEPQGWLLPGKASVIVGDDLLRAPANLRAEGALTPNRSCAWAAKQGRESKQETAMIK